MRIQIVPQEADHAAAVRSFNARLDAAGTEAFRLGEIEPERGAYCDGVSFRNFLAIDDRGEVRGGYFMRMQPMQVRGSVHAVGQYRAPLSEGIVDKRYMAVGPMMLAHAMKIQPLLYSSGMGGPQLPLPRMMKSLGWHVMEAPFWFRVLHGGRFLRNIGPLRKDLPRRVIGDLLAFTGVGGAGIAIAQALRTSALRGERPDVETLRSFDERTTEIWRQCAGDYSFSAMRTPDFLRFNYPTLTEPYTTLGLSRDGSFAGWVNLLDCKPQNAAFFGNMKVAALIDGVAPRKFIPELVRAAVVAAKENGSDMIFSNQTHQDWTDALRNAGFWRGPSNYLLALSKALVKLLEPMEEAIPRINFNRGDGDGRVNLLPADAPSTS